MGVSFGHNNGKIIDSQRDRRIRIVILPKPYPPVKGLKLHFPDGVRVDCYYKYFFFAISRDRI